MATHSNAEAKFRSMAHGVCKLLWLRLLLSKLGFPIISPIRLYCDNKVVISIAHNPIQYYRNKRIEVDRHFIKEKLLVDIICTPFVKMEDQLDDMFTKGLRRDLFHSLVRTRVFFNLYHQA